MSSANPLWGALRIASALSRVGIDVAKSTVEKDMVRARPAPSPTWKTVLKNHIESIVAIGFFVVPTGRNQSLFAFLVLAHNHRRVLHFNATANPTAEWTAQQLVEAFPWKLQATYLLRDRDKICDDTFRKRVRGMCLEEALIAPRSPWQNSYVERMIGSIRRDCLDHVMVLNERRLRRVVSNYLDCDHHSRTHLVLDMDCPEQREVQEVSRGQVIEVSEVRGLRQSYERRAA